MITVGEMVSRPGVQDSKTSSGREPPRAGEVLASGRVLSRLHLSTAEPLLPPQASSSQGPPQPGLGLQALPQLATESVRTPCLSAPHPPPGPAKPAGPSRFSVSQLPLPSPAAPLLSLSAGQRPGSHFTGTNQSASPLCV